MTFLLRDGVFPLLTVLAISPAMTAAHASERVVHRYLEVAMSPDGRHVASVEGDSSPSGGEPVIRNLTIRTVDSGTAVAVALPCGAVRECWPSSPAWSPDGARLAFALRTPGTHARSIYTAAADGSGLIRLLAFDGTITGLRYGRDGRLAMLAVEGARKEVGATQPGAPITGDLGGPPTEQRIAILAGGKLAWSSPADMFVYQYDWRPDGTGFVGTAAPGDGDNNWWVAKLYAFDAKDGAARAIFAAPDARHQIADPVVSPDGQQVAFISGIMSDFGSTGGDIYTVPAAGGIATDITPDMHASARSIAWSCGGALRAELLAGATTQLVEFADATKGATPAIQWQGEQTLHGENGGVSMACPSAVTVAVHESFAAPPEIETGAFGKWRDITQANAALSMPLIAQSIAWQSDGAQVQGWLLLPLEAKGKLPLITIAHGGPAAAAVPGFSGPGLQHDLLERGYALFLPNPRGSFGQGEAFAAANVRDLGHGDLRDILAGIDEAERAAPIDDNRLGITGGSYGGFMTMWAVTQTQRFKAGVAGAGLSDWQSYYGENGIDEWMIPYFGASVYADPKIYALSSPIDYITNVKTPVFAYVGADDIECPAPQTQEFWHALHDLGVPASYAIYPGEGHGLRDPAHIADVKARTLAWFDRWLPVENATFADAASQAPLKITAGPVSATYGLGEPVFVDLQVANLGSEPASVDLGGDGKTNLLVTITGPGGRSSAVRLPSGGLMESGEHVLGANATVTERLILNEWNEFREAGDYIVGVALVPEFGPKADAAPTANLHVSIGPRNESELGAEAKALADLAIDGDSVAHRRAAALALSYVADPVAVPEMARVLSSGSDAGTPLISGLARLGGPSALKALQSARSSPDEEVRAAAIGALRALRDGRPVSSQNSD